MDAREASRDTCSIVRSPKQLTPVNQTDNQPPMPDFSFEIVDAQPAARGLTPMLHFLLHVTNARSDERIQAVLLRTQIQIQPSLRAYTVGESERLDELLTEWDRSSQTQGNKLWTQVDVNVPAFIGGEVEVRLPVPCTFDTNVLASKYFCSLDGGDVSLLFLFSGTVFYTAGDGTLQIQQIPWEKRCTYRMPMEKWRELMDQSFPGTAWVSLQRDAFDRLNAYKQRHGLLTWEEAVDRLLAAEISHEISA
jgi:hypothetical protein